MIGFLTTAIALLFFLGAPIFIVILGFSMVGAASGGNFDGSFAGQLSSLLNTALGEHGTILATVPLFIFAGYVMAESKTADRLVEWSQALLGPLPGGLAIVTVLTCAVFTTFTGASGVTIVAIGGLLYPALIKEKYPEKTALGLITGTGSIGLLFPPAVPLFVFGTVFGLQKQYMDGVEFSTDRFIWAGIVPGILLCTLVSSVAVWTAIRKKTPRKPMDLGKFLQGFKRALPESILPLLIIGALSKGVQIPEVAALTCLYVLALEIFVYKDIKITALSGIAREAIVLSGAILIIVFSAAALTNYFAELQIPNKMVGWVQNHVDSKIAFLLALNILLIVVGMMMDIFSAIVIVVPLIAQVAVKGYGIDPFHLGVIFLVNLEIGYLTPPVGLNLFISAFKFEKPATHVIKASAPYLGAMIVALGIITYIPALTVVPPAKRTMTAESLAMIVRDGRRAVQMVQSVELPPNGKTFEFKNCMELDRSRNAYANCENFFAEYTECDSDECRQEAMANFGDSLSSTSSCIDYDYVPDCKEFAAWSRKTLEAEYVDSEEEEDGDDDTSDDDTIEDCTQYTNPIQREACEAAKEESQDSDELNDEDEGDDDTGDEEADDCTRYTNPIQREACEAAKEEGID